MSCVKPPLEKHSIDIGGTWNVCAPGRIRVSKRMEEDERLVCVCATELRLDMEGSGVWTAVARCVWTAVAWCVWTAVAWYSLDGRCMVQFGRPPHGMFGRPLAEMGRKRMFARPTPDFDECSRLGRWKFCEDSPIFRSETYRIWHTHNHPASGVLEEGKP
jgi:hypothetical protein